MNNDLFDFKLTLIICWLITYCLTIILIRPMFEIAIIIAILSLYFVGFLIDKIEDYQYQQSRRKLRR